jgi:mRNA-degrading endonuclease toxin of MazEF toxin-antitoxin module
MAKGTVATIATSKIERRFGRLAEADLRSVDLQLRAVFGI